MAESDTEVDASAAEAEANAGAQDIDVAAAMGLDKDVSLGNDKGFDIGGLIGSILGLDKKGDLTDRAVLSAIGGMVIGTLASAAQSKNEAQIQDAMEKGNFRADGSMYGHGAFGEEVNIAAGPGGLTGIDAGLGGAGAGGNDSAGPGDGDGNDSEQPGEDTTDPGETNNFSGISPWEHYQRSLMKHPSFRISVPSIVDFPNAMLPTMEKSSNIANDPNMIPVHVDDLASPLTAIIRTGNRSLKGAQ